MLNSLKTIFKALFSLNVKQLFQVFKLAIAHPFLFTFGGYATLKAYALASKKFPKTHAKDGKANAFRHALWTGLIANYCAKITSIEKAILFSQKLTDTHEDLFPNPPMQRKMDLHNNRIGLMVFRDIVEAGVHRQFVEKSFLVDALLQKMQSAKYAQSEEEIKGKEMVYIAK